MANVMTPAKQLEVQKSVYDVCKNGKQVTLLKDDIEGGQDSFGDTLTEEPLKLFAFPIRFTPFDRKTRLNVEWSSEVEIILYVSVYEVDQNGLECIDLEKFNYIHHNYKRYRIKKVQPYSAFGAGFLYYQIGGTHV